MSGWEAAGSGTKKGAGQRVKRASTGGEVSSRKRAEGEPVGRSPGVAHLLSVK